MKNKILRAAGAGLLVVLCVYGVLLYLNNRNMVPVERQVLDQHLEKAIQWMVRNEKTVLADDNTVLWWMVFESEQRRHDPRLADLLNKYFRKYPASKDGPWGPFFAGKKMLYVPQDVMAGFPYYDLYLLYAVQCAEELARDNEIIRAQNSPYFCYKPAYFLRPACTTHQIMGVYFLERQACNNGQDMAAVMSLLQQDIVRQLTLDVRVVDVYVQRVLMLAVTGARDKIKPVWVQRVLDHQLADGGWSGFAPLVPVANGRSIGFDSKAVVVDSPASNFHTTAQAVCLLTLLSHEQGVNR